MIDFRYHLVSLISVFLALAVGVVLGAGPLQNSIGAALQEQVNELRVDRDNLRTERDQAREQTSRDDAFVQSVAGRLVGTGLEGQTVAMVAAPGADDADLRMVADSITSAGGTVSTTVRLNDAWTQADRLQYRTTVAGQMFTYLSPAPPAESGTDGVLSAALTQMLVGGDDQLSDPGVDPVAEPSPEATASGDVTTPPAPVEQPENTPAEAQQANELLQLLSTGDTPLVSVTGAPGVPATAVMVVGPRHDPATTGQDLTSEQRTAQEMAGSTLRTTVRALAASVPGIVVLGSADAPEELVSLMRSDEFIVEHVSTADSVGVPRAAATAILGLEADLRGAVGHYGFETGAEAIVPQAGAGTDAAAADGAGTPTPSDTTQTP